MTDTELMILSLVSEKPRYGYEIQRLIDERNLRDWLPVGYASIYYLLNRLERQNMLQGDLISDGRGPARKKYRLTDAGQGILQTSLSNLLRQPRTPGTGFEFALANLHIMNPATVYRILAQHRDDLRAQISAQRDTLNRYTETDTQTPAYSIHTLFTHSIHLAEAEVAWLDDFLADWQNKHAAAIAGTETAASRDPGSAPTLLNRSPDSVHALQKLKRVPRDDDAPDTPEA